MLRPNLKPNRSMKRTILLLVPVIALAATGADSGRKSKEEALGALWQESVSKESGGEQAEALQLASQYLKDGGDAYLATMRAAWLNYNQKNYDEAARHYANATRMQPGALSPRLGLLNIAKDKQDVPGAAKAGELVLALEPSNYRALYAVAWAAFEAKNYAKAGSVYRQILRFYPEELDAVSGAAWSSFYQGQKMEARAGFRKLVSVNPDYSYARQGIEACK